MTTTPYTFRVCYSDTDTAGFVYHARYLEIFERSRAAWLHGLGIGPLRLVEEFGILFPVRELSMNFHRPGRLDDLLVIGQIIEHRGRTQIAIKQTAKKINEANPSEEPTLLASALIHLVAVDTKTHKPKGLPEWLFPLVDSVDSQKQKT
jgi:acyl-CoA thioester hydrolase